MTAKSLPHQDEKHVFDRGVVHARYGRIRTGQRNRPFFQGLPIFLLYHGSACNRLKPIPQQGPVPHHAQNRRFRRGVAQNPRLVSHFGTKDSTSQSDQQTRPIPSRWREVARSTGGWTNGRTDAKPTKHKTTPSPATREPSGPCNQGRPAAASEGKNQPLPQAGAENRART